MRLVSFDYFRAIAIILIVAGHSYDPWIINSVSDRVLANLISGGSALGVVLLAVLQMLNYPGYGNFHKPEIFSFEGIDIIIVQKIMLCLFFLAILQRLASFNLPVLRVIAASSFAIYFIHP